MHLGYASPSRMLEEMTREEWEDWQAFMALEPFLEAQANVQHADLTALIRNIARDTKAHPNAYTAEECILRFGDDLPPAPTRKLDWRVSKANFFKAVGVTRDDEKSPRRRAAPVERPPRPPRQKRGRR